MSGNRRPHKHLEHPPKTVHIARKLGWLCAVSLRVIPWRRRKPSWPRNRKIEKPPPQPGASRERATILSGTFTRSHLVAITEMADHLARRHLAPLPPAIWREAANAPERLRTAGHILQTLHHRPTYWSVGTRRLSSSNQFTTIPIGTKGGPDPVSNWEFLTKTKDVPSGCTSQLVITGDPPKLAPIQGP